MHERLGAGFNPNRLCTLHEPGAGHDHRVFAKRHSDEFEVAVDISVDAFRPVGRFRLQHHHRPLYRTMLRIMNDPAYRAEDCGTDSDGEQEQSTSTENTNDAHAFSKHLLKPRPNPNAGGAKAFSEQIGCPS